MLSENYRADGDWIFIHYSIHPKLGINPRTNSALTPAGIYGFPESVVDSAERDGLRVGREGFSRRRYLVRFMVKPESRRNMLIFDSNDGESSFFLSPEELYEALEQQVVMHFSNRLNIWNNVKSSNRKRHGGKVTYEEVYETLNASIQGRSKAKALRGIGCEGIVDLSGMIYGPSEPYQGVFFSIKSLVLLSIEDQHRGREEFSQRIDKKIKVLMSGLYFDEDNDWGVEFKRPKYLPAGFDYVASWENGDLHVEFGRRTKSREWYVKIYNGTLESVFSLGPTIYHALHNAAKSGLDSSADRQMYRQIIDLTKSKI